MDIDNLSDAERAELCKLTATFEYFETKYSSDQRSDDLYLIDGLIEPASIVLLYGAPKTGKTLLTTDLATSLSDVDHWLGRNIPKPANVIYLAYEDPKSIIQRMQCIFKYKFDKDRHIENRIFVSAQPPDILNSNFENALQFQLRWLRYDDDTNVRLQNVLIVDTLAMAMGGKGDENSSGFMGLFIDKFRSIRNLGITVIIVHHTGKDPKKGSRGHNSLVAAADTVFFVEKKANSNLLTLTRELYRNGPAGEKFTFEIESGTLSDELAHNSDITIVPYLKHLEGFSNIKNETALTRPQILVLNSIQRLLQTDPTDVGMMFGKAGYHAAVSYKLIEADCIQKNISPNAKSPAAPKKAVRRALDYLVENRMADERDGFIWPVAMEQTDSDKTESS